MHKCKAEMTQEGRKRRYKIQVDSERRDNKYKTMRKGGRADKGKMLLQGERKMGIGGMVVRLKNTEGIRYRTDGSEGHDATVYAIVKFLEHFPFRLQSIGGAP